MELIPFYQKQGIVPDVIDSRADTLSKAIARAIPSAPDQAVYNGVRVQLKYLLSATNVALLNYMAARELFDSFNKWYFATPLPAYLNNQIDPIIIDFANAIRKMQKGIAELPPIVNEYTQAILNPSSAVAGVGQIPLTIAAASVSLGAVLFSYFWTQPDMASWDALAEQRKYDLDTLKQIEIMGKTGKTYQEIANYEKLRATHRPPSAPPRSFLEAVTGNKGAANMGILILAGIAALFLMQRKR